MTEQERLEEAVRACGDGIVYFAQAEPCGPIKIGYTTRPRLKARMSVIQTGCPFPLRLCRTFPGTRSLEAKLHRTFRKHHMHGEWFYPDPAVAAVAHATPTPEFA